MKSRSSLSIGEEPRSARRSAEDVQAHSYRDQRVDRYREALVAAPEQPDQVRDDQAPEDKVPTLPPPHLRNAEPMWHIS